MKPEQQHKKMTQNEQDGSSDQSNPSWTCKVSNVFTWHLMKILLMGQGLSVMICATALTSQYLASDFHFNTPMLQSFVLYVLLCMTYTTTLIFKEGDGNILQILKKKWWKYILLSLTDVEANYTVVKAYQYTTLTSVQLLDCFVIPVIMLLSWFFLKTRYRVLHLVAVCVCLMGVGAMVGADLLTGRDQGSSSNILLGDVLILISATLYGISNVCQEYTVKHLSRAEFLGMLGLFGTIISGIQLGILEHRIVAVIQWSWQIVLLLGGYSLGMYGLYSFMPIVVKMSSAAAVNLSLLTADIFSVICGIFLFHYAFSGLHIMSLVLIFVGFIMFHSVPMPNPSPEAHSEDGGCENNAFDEEGSLEEVAAQASENTEDQGSDCKERTCNSPLENPAVSVVKCSVKL